MTTTDIEQDRRLVAEKLLGWLPPDFDDGMDGWTLPEGSMEDQQLDYLATWNGAGEVLEALRGRCCVDAGDHISLFYGKDGYSVILAFLPPPWEEYIADNGPDAVIRAAAQVCRDS